MYIAICDDDEKYTDLISGYLDQDSINCPDTIREKSLLRHTETVKNGRTRFFSTWKWGK